MNEPVRAGLDLHLGHHGVAGDPADQAAEPVPCRGCHDHCGFLVVLVIMAAAVGCAGGIYGIGGGSILAPILIGSGRRPAEVAPAALASTFVTSVAGVITFTILSIHQHGSVAPDWPTGIALGAGGLAGAYTCARIQSRIPGALIRRLVGTLVIVIGARSLWVWPELTSHRCPALSDERVILADRVTGLAAQ